MDPLDLDKEPTVNVNSTRIPVVKCQAAKPKHEGGKMGWTVPQSTLDFFTDIRKPLIRSSPLGCLDRCPRMFLYEYRLGIIPRRYESALTMGDIVHKVLQARFMGQNEDEALQVCERILAKNQEKLIADAGPDGFLPTGESLEAQLKKVEEDYHKARATGLVFWRQVPFSQDEWEILRTPDGDPMIEMILEAEYPGLNRPIRTPCDVVLVHKETGEVWIVDFKTTSYDPKMRAIPTKISAQLAIYRLSLQSHLDAWHEAGLAPKRTVAGSFHAIIRKPGIKLCNADHKNAAEWGCTPFAAYIRRLVEWYQNEEAKKPDNPPMVLDPNRFSGPLMTQELFRRLKQFCKAAWASPNVSNFYRVGESACLQYNRPCAYMELCNSDPVMWPSLIEQKYEIKFREDEENHHEDV